MFVWRNTSNRLQLWQSSESLVRQAAHKANSKKLVSRIFVSSIAIVSQSASQPPDTSWPIRGIHTNSSVPSFVRMYVFWLSLWLLHHRTFLKIWTTTTDKKTCRPLPLFGRWLFIFIPTEKQSGGRSKNSHSVRISGMVWSIHPSIYLFHPSIRPIPTLFLPCQPSQNNTTIQSHISGSVVSRLCGRLYTS